MKITNILNIKSENTYSTSKKNSLLTNSTKQRIKLIKKIATIDNKNKSINKLIKYFSKNFFITKTDLLKAKNDKHLDVNMKKLIEIVLTYYNTIKILDDSSIIDLTISNKDLLRLKDLPIKVKPATIYPKADQTQIKIIKKAVLDIWNGTSPYLQKKAFNWAHSNFLCVKDFQNFMINWANVETGGNFNNNHFNISSPNIFVKEKNHGIFQINERWATKPKSNPNNWNIKKAYDTYMATHWALNHLLNSWNYNKSKGNIRLLLEGYWHGTHGKNQNYTKGVLNGHIIKEQE